MALLPAMTAWAEVGDEFTKNNLKYKVTSENPNTVELTGYDGEKPTGALDIPAMVKNGGMDYEVTSIGEKAFHECYYLTSIVIPASVTSIGKSAFYRCTTLASVIIGEGVTSIGQQAFSTCYFLKSVTFAEGSKLMVIGAAAFYAEHSLASIIIPASVTTIGDYAFYASENLFSVSFAEGSKLESIGLGAFCDCPLKSIILPENVTTIGEGAFTRCNNLQSVVIPASVTTIGDQAFRSCSNLISVTFAKGSQLTNLGAYTFNGCSNLTSFTIPAEMKSIGDYAFDDCKSMEDVYCYADPTVLTWSGADNSFKNNKATICHVADVDAWTEKFANVNVTFVGDLSTDINALSPAIIEGKRAVYNLAGQRIGGMAKGLNIVDGRKVMVK